MSCRKPCARNVLWKQLETPKTSESNFSVSNKMFRCIIFVTICSSSFEFPEKKTEMLALAPVHTCTYVFRCLLQYLCAFNIQIQIYAFYVYIP